MRQGAEAVGTRHIQIQQQQIGARMLLEGVKQAGDAIGFEELAVGAALRDGAPERGAEQRMIIDNEDFVVHLQAAVGCPRDPGVNLL